MQNRRRSYHTDLKLAYQLGLVPQNLIQHIPRSSRHRFQSTDYTNLVGSEFSQFLEKIDLVKKIMSSASTLAVASAFFRIISLLRSLHLSLAEVPKIKNKEFRSQIVKRVLSVSKYIPLGTILAFLKLSHHRFMNWKRKPFSCQSSPLGLCRVSFPGQLRKVEVQSIRKAFLDQKTVHWPSSSIAWKLISDGNVSANVSTILKYAKAMGLTANRKLPHRSRKKGSIVTTRPNEAWHIDVTVLRTPDGIKSYIQLIIDSFSKRILAYSVSLSISGKATTDLLRSTFVSLPCEPKKTIMLISDGGSENVNVSVKEYLASVSLKLHVAHVDVSFSNSMIEAVNKILKYRYIFRKNIPSFSSVEPIVKESVADYNARPHYSLHGLCPDEAYEGKIFDTMKYKEHLILARSQRLIENKNNPHPCKADSEISVIPEKP